VSIVPPALYGVTFRLCEELSAAVELKKHAATLLAESAELEKQISRLKGKTPSQTRKT
jgi:hypothetical protein